MSENSRGDFFESKCILKMATKLRPMINDPSSASKLLVPESRTRNYLEVIAHVLFCPSFWYMVPDKSSTRMHDRLAKLLVRDSGTSNLDGEPGSCAMVLKPTGCHVYIC